MYSQAVTCACGDKFPRHPAMEVPCPSCRAKIGQRCVRPSEHGCEFHSERKKAAFDAHPCSCLTTWQKDRQQERNRFLASAFVNDAVWERGEQELQRAGVAVEAQ